jgi:hypothetical protein
LLHRLTELSDSLSFFLCKLLFFIRVHSRSCRGNH